MAIFGLIGTTGVPPFVVNPHVQPMTVRTLRPLWHRGPAPGHTGCSWPLRLLQRAWCMELRLMLWLMLRLSKCFLLNKSMFGAVKIGKHHSFSYSCLLSQDPCHTLYLFLGWSYHHYCDFMFGAIGHLIDSALHGFEVKELVSACAEGKTEVSDGSCQCLRDMKR